MISVCSFKGLIHNAKSSLKWLHEFSRLSFKRWEGNVGMIDVLITSTCRNTIERTINSFIDNVYCSLKFNFIVNVDIKNKKYLPRLMEILREHEVTDLSVNHKPEPKPMGLVNAVNNLYRRIKSPYFFNLEDDWIFLKKINIDPLIKLMECDNGIDHIRFNKEKTKGYAWLYHLSEQDVREFRKDNLNQNFNGINLVKTHVWSFNPSLVRTSIVKQILPVPVNVNAEKYFCFQYGKIIPHGGTYIYGEIGDKAVVKDIGRNIMVEYLRFLKHKTFGW